MSFLADAPTTGNNDPGAFVPGAAGFGAAIGGSPLDGNKVFLGHTRMPGEFDRSAGPRPKGGPERETSVNDAINQFWQWSDAEKANLGEQLHRAGLINDPSNFDAVMAQWTNAVQYAANAYSIGHQRLTPWQALNMKLGLAESNAAKSQGPRTSTSRSVNLPSKEDADALVKSVFQNALGRDPEDGELDRYRRMIMAQYRANPEVSTTTVTTDGKGNQRSSSRSSGGLSAGAAQSFLQDKAKADPEWGAYQAATTYMNALEQALGAPG